MTSKSQHTEAVVRIEYESAAFGQLLHALTEAHQERRDLSVLLTPAALKLKVGEGAWSLDFPTSHA